MPEEYYIPPMQGLFEEASRMRMFKHGEKPPAEIALRKKDFDYLGNWITATDREGYGIFYRIGIRENVENDEGDIATLAFHFYVPFAKTGLKMTEEKEKEILGKLEKLIEISTIAGRFMFSGNMVGCLKSPPNWMIEELQEISGVNLKYVE